MAIIDCVVAILLTADGGSASDVPLEEVMAVRVELAQMVALDQSFRKAASRSLSEEKRQALSALYKKKFGEIDEKNTARLKQLIAKYGWIRSTVFGDDASHCAWLLLQHADRDKAFQSQLLPVLERAAAVGDADGADVALLTDRVLAGQNKPLRYGTQGMCVAKGKWEPRPVEEPKKLDERRAKVGLPPEAEYVAEMNSFCLEDERGPQAKDGGVK